MTDTELYRSARPPFHLWVVGLLSLLWNASGAYTILLAQAGRWPGISAEEAAYYAAQAPWFVAVTDIALFSGIAGAIALLLRHRWAVPLFAISLIAIVVGNGHDIAAGTSRMGTNTATMTVTVLIWALAILQLLYATWMRRRAVLR